MRKKVTKSSRLKYMYVGVRSFQTVSRKLGRKTTYKEFPDY